MIRLRFCLDLFFWQMDGVLQRMIVPAVMQIKEIETQGIHTDGEAGQAHRSSTHHRIDLQRGQSGSHRDQDEVVEEGPEEILMDGAQSRSA